MPAVPEDAAAPIVPGYRLQELLGRGGSGEVWRAVPRGGGAPVAVKVLVAGNPERQAREAALLAELDHPHLVRLHEVVHQPRRGGEVRVALVLDLLPGGSLAALLARRGRLRPGEVVTAIAPVAAALAHAHEHGVVHGDLSPGNIVFTAEGRPVLTDLGVARVLGESAAGEVTPAYVDPTVARGGAPGPASDVFGVAAAAFHALTGIAPWNAASPADTLAVAAAGVLPDLAELAPEAPAELVAVIARGLADDPHERGSAGAFALDLRHACRPEPVRLPTAGVPDEELGRTGRGPRTELTHQVPGRHRREPRPEPVEPRRDRVVPVLRRVAVLAAVGATLAAAVWLGTRWGAGGGAAPAAATAPATAVAPSEEPEVSVPAEPLAAGAPADPAGWQPVLAELYGRRAEAFATASPGPLDDVYTEDSAQRAADVAFVEELAAAGQVLRGFAPSVLRVTAVTLDGDRAEVELVDAWPGYDVVPAGTADGPAVRSAPGRPEAPVRMVLRRTDDGWRIEHAERV
ncbi:protein kinase domain-containing protein [Geodermatophilus sp. URMC 64]